jgi:hypothetical protein
MQTFVNTSLNQARAVCLLGLMVLLASVARGDVPGCSFSELSSEMFSTMGNAVDVDLGSDVVYVTNLQGELVIIGETEPGMMGVLGIYHQDDPFSFGFKTVVDSGYAYMTISGSADALLVVDVSDPSSPTFVSSYESQSGNVFGVSILDGVAYIADGSNGIEILDVSDPSSISRLGIDKAGLESTGVAVVRDGLRVLAYVAQGSMGLRILDVTDPGSIVVLGEVDTAGGAVDVVVLGSYAYVADGPGGMVIVDVSDPASANIVGQLSTEGIARSLVVKQGLVYVGVDQLGVHAVDVRDVVSPKLAGVFGDAQIYSGFDVVDEQVDNQVAYLPGGADGLVVMQLEGALCDCPLERECPGDMTGDGNLNSFDISGFLSAFRCRDMRADFVCDGEFNFFDVAEFLQAFQAGCP